MSGNSDLFAAIRSKDPEAVRRAVEADPVAVHALDEGGNSPLLVAIYHGAPEIAEVLLSCGARLDVFTAAALGKLDTVRALVGREPDLVHAHSNDGWTPLHLAAFFGKADVAEFLLEAGADLRSVSENPTGNTPLHAAAAGGQTDTARLLLARGADVNARARGYTPLHLAAAGGRRELVELLLASGADRRAEDSLGDTPAALARMKGRLGIIDLLEGFEP